MVELSLLSPICLHSMVLKYIAFALMKVVVWKK
jgi:hypothetical protein